MKKILLLTMLAAYSHISNAQSAEETVISNFDTTSVTTKTPSIQERLNKQDVEIQALKKENNSLKKQMKQGQPSEPTSTKKLTISRTGSKQLIAQ